MESLLNQLRHQPEQVGFESVIKIIDQHYHYTPTSFTNGLGKETLANPAGSNEGSCRIFAFAQMQQLSEAETLACFGRYYRENVLQNPAGDDHKNIRNFLKYGWQGIQFSAQPLYRK